MLESESHDGLFVFLAGMIILVLSGVAGSLLLDRSFNATEAQKDLSYQIKEQAMTMRFLRDQLDLKKAKLGKSEQESEARQEKLRLMQTSEAAMRSYRENNVRLIRKLADEICELEASHQTERLRIRKWIWAKAVGQSLGNLSTIDGRTYQDAKIVRITDQGVIIRHAHGSASIEPDNLPVAFRDQFDLNLSVPANQPGGGSASEGAVDTAQSVVGPIGSGLLKARKELHNSGVKLSLVSGEYHVALSHDYQSGSRFVTGSLEMWTARMNRLSRELADAWDAYAAARRNLSAISPDDPLLDAWPSRPAALHPSP